jgi:TonB family protein
LVVLCALSVPVFAQSGGKPTPRLVHFVAPPYPRQAKDQSLIGTASFMVTVAKSGTVSAVKTISSHPVFEKPVTDAIAQWRFEPAAEVYNFAVTFTFEFYDEPCDKPLTPETRVVADLPTSVTIRTGQQCVKAPAATRRQPH